MNSLTIFFLVVVGLVSAHESPVVEHPVHSEHAPAVVAAPEAHHHGAPVQAQPVPVHVVEYSSSQQSPADAHKNLYMPSSLVESSSQNQKPAQVGPIVNKEQYGAPEPAGMPANYKPFGSWGLYIGGNPPDGYYTNYYKNVDGLQGAQGSQGQQMSGVHHHQSSPLSPYVYKQSGPVGHSEFMQPFVYSADELNSAYPISHFPSSYMPGFVGGEQSGPVAPEFYAGKTSKVGSPAQQVREISKTSSQAAPSGTKGTKSPVQQHQYQQKTHQVEQQQVKGQQQVAYSPVAYEVAHAPVQQYYQRQHHQQQQVSQVLPYSVPVGSQIVGSQPGSDGAFSPYGVHAFTRYAVKPAVGQNQYYQHSAPVPFDNVAHQSYDQSVYKQQRAQYQPFGYYQPSTFGYQGYQLGVPAMQHQFSAHGVSNSPSAQAPVANVEDVEQPQAPVQQVQQVQYAPAPVAPVVVVPKQQQQYQYSAHSQVSSSSVAQAPVAPMESPVASAESPKSPVVAVEDVEQPQAAPVSPVQVAQAQAAPASPVQVGKDHAASPMEQQQEKVHVEQQQQQVVEKQGVKSAIKQ